MKNMSSRAFKDEVYGAFSDVAKAFSNPVRLELVDLLVQRGFRVEELAEAVGRSLGNTSQHLQVLKRARLVQTTRHGTAIEYSLAPGVAEVYVALRRLAEARSAELSVARQAFYSSREAPDTISSDDVRAQLARSEAVLIDVRPRAEFEAGHIAGARSVPIDELEAHLDDLPRDKLLVATCRGPYCVFAAQAVQRLRAGGFRAVRFEDGVAEWRASGGDIAAAVG